MLANSFGSSNCCFNASFVAFHAAWHKIHTLRFELLFNIGYELAEYPFVRQRFNIASYRDCFRNCTRPPGHRFWVKCARSTQTIGYNKYVFIMRDCYGILIVIVIADSCLEAILFYVPDAHAESPEF